MTSVKSPISSVTDSIHKYIIKVYICIESNFK